MDEKINITQKGSWGGETTQIGVQNNYVGMTPIQACTLATNLFWENFPKLQEQAMEVASKRVDEFVNEVMRKIEKEHIVDLSSFADPDVQYVLLKAQCDYARFGEEELLNTLTDLVAQRVRCVDSIILKTTLDRAISVAGMVTPEELDYLTLLFLSTRVAFYDVSSIEDLERILVHICSVLKVAVGVTQQSHLIMLGCLQIELPNPVRLLADSHHFSEEQVRAICPDQIKRLRGDYGISSVGIALAVINAKEKLGYRFDLKEWIGE